MHLKNIYIIGNNMRNNSGLTLVETLIATAIIAIVMVIATNLILLFMQTESETGDMLALEGVSRQILSQITEISREGYVDYDHYSSLPLAFQQEQLAFRDLSGVQTVFWFYTDATIGTHAYICEAQFNAPPCPNSGNPIIDPEWNRVDPQDITLEHAWFYIRPDTAPYISGPPFSDTAPIIIVTLQLLGKDGAVSNLIQTSFTTRMYVR